MEWHACLASSLDGKITTAGSNTSWARLGSDADLKRLFTLRDTAQALLFGANTLRAHPKIRWGLRQKEVGHPALHIILTRSGKLPWDGPLFTQWQPDWPPIAVISPVASPEEAQALIEAGLVVWLQAASEEASAICQTVRDALAPYTVDRLLIEGGGEIIALCLEAKALTHASITLTPWLIGGSTTAGLVAGNGYSALPCPRLADWHVTRVENELFLEGSIAYPEGC